MMGALASERAEARHQIQPDLSSTNARSSRDDGCPRCGGTLGSV
jgi:hypothetical protein